MTPPVEGTNLQVPQGRFCLRRWPRVDGDRLLAWDAADNYLLHHLHDEPLAEGEPVCIVNDGFGTLTVALAARQAVHMWSDSWLARAGTLANLVDNGLAADAANLVSSLEYPASEFGTVLIKIPKSLALLEDQLHRLRGHLRPGARILGAGMVKMIHTSTLKLFEEILGPTRTSLARRKARLVYSELNQDLAPGPSPYPTEYHLDGSNWVLRNHAGLFSRGGLDAGTRRLLSHIPATDEAQDIVDVGCGNGVIGLSAARQNPRARLTFVDESFMAVASAQHNWRVLFGEARPAEFEIGDCLKPLAAGSADLILCNPPFHQHRAMGDATAWRMFTGARQVLRPGGELLVVGNRHLAYHAKLRRLFGHCDLVDSDRKFVVLRCRRR